MSTSLTNLNCSSEITVKNFADKSNDYCVIVGVLNEGKKFSDQLSLMQPYRNMVDIIIADGGSSDGATAEGAINNQANVIITDRRRTGLSGQYQAALAYAYDAGYKGMIMVDGNGKDGVEAIPQFIARLKDGFDFVQGSRFLPGGEHLNTPRIRHFAIRLIFCPIMTIASGFAYTDAINGFKAVSRNLIENSKMQIFRNIFQSYSLQYYLNYRAPSIGLKTCEVAVTRNYPSRNNFPTKIHGVRAYLNILSLLISTCFGKYNTD